MNYADYELLGKNALVTGVSRKIGIGAAVSLALAKAGANVFTTYYRPNDPPGSNPLEADEIIAQLQREGVKSAGIEADLSNPEMPKLIFDRATSELGKIDILINNATLDILSDVYTMDSVSLDSHYAVNIRGTTLLCKEFAERHDGRLGGRIINLTSGQSLGPMPDNLPYAITKGAIEALTLSLSKSLLRKNITINAVDPGGTDTGWMNDSLVKDISSKTLYGRVGMPQDAANLILFLASVPGGWITGQVLHSRGGI
jgi:3-oxoacyl-[acyl-carrier protein] reductase